MSSRTVLFAIIAVFCCVATVSCEGAAIQAQVASPAWDEAKGIADEWPDAPEQMSAEQLLKVEQVARAVAARLQQNPHDADALALQAAVEMHSAYIEELRDSIREDVYQADLAPQTGSRQPIWRSR